MAYRDRDKQRETTRERVRRYRSNQKALQEGVTKPSKALQDEQGVTGVTFVTSEPYNSTTITTKPVPTTLTKPNKPDTKPLTRPKKSITEHPNGLNTKLSRVDIKGIDKSLTRFNNSSFLPPQPLHDKGAIEMLFQRMKAGTPISDSQLPFSKSKQTKGHLR